MITATTTQSLFRSYKELRPFFVEFVSEHRTINNQTVGSYAVEKYSIPLGKAINLLNDLNKTPFWKKKYYHEHLKDILTNALDEVKINIYL